MVIYVAFSVTPRASDGEFLAVAEINDHGLEPWRMYKEGRLSSDGIETNHIPEKPGLHCSCITISWKP